MQTLKRRGSPCKYKNDPSRFLGEGITFKAKLIGILEVSEARGDKMCQDALNDLKTAIRAAGEHKQRITINISIDGLRLRDEKTGVSKAPSMISRNNFLAALIPFLFANSSQIRDCLYHHPVHKISFIAQDMSDSRAFGYIFGSPDTGHRFFGIKTDKSASQVVISMRDLFQVVFELKKKELEMSKHHAEQSHKYGSTGYMDSIHLPKDESESDKTKGKHTQSSKAKISTLPKLSDTASASFKTGSNSEAIADLLDLDQGMGEMNNLAFGSDPFGPLFKDEAYNLFDDSFPCTAAADESKSKNFAVSCVMSEQQAAENLCMVDSRQDSFFGATSSASNTDYVSRFPSEGAKSCTNDSRWFPHETESLFKDSAGANDAEPTSPPRQRINSERFSDVNQAESSKKSPIRTDLFTELDPLGTGRVKPYIDKKDFFQELKNPPKKILKELITDGTSAEATPPLHFPALFAESKNESSGMAEPVSSGQVDSAQELKDVNVPARFSRIDPFKDADPFEKTDPFREENISVDVEFPPLFASKCSSESIFDEGIQWKSNGFRRSQRESEIRSSQANYPMFSSIQSSVLRVSLPPERKADKTSSSSSSRVKSPPSSPDNSKAIRANRYKSLPSKSVDDENGSPAVEQPFIKTEPMQNKSSPYKSKFFSGVPPLPGTDAAKNYTKSEISDSSTPDPPPRTKASLFTIKPPPLPPKKLGHNTSKPPARPPSRDESLPHYDFVKQRESVFDCSQFTEELKSVKSKRESITGKEFSQSTESKKSDSDREFPILPPPPQRKGSADAGNFNSVQRQQSKALKPVSNGEKGSVLDLKLTQLDGAGLENLAATLGLPSESVYAMTLQELTKMLAEKYLTTETNGGHAVDATSNGTFEADFDSNFANAKDAGQPFAYDRYAAFKELIESEKRHSEMSPSIGDHPSGKSGDGEVDARKSEDKYEALRQLSLNAQKVKPACREDEAAGKSESASDKDEEKFVTSGVRVTLENDKRKKESLAETTVEPGEGSIEKTIDPEPDPTMSFASVLIASEAKPDDKKDGLFSMVNKFSEDAAPAISRERWATFDKSEFAGEVEVGRSGNTFNNNNENSPFSSDGKEEEEEERVARFQWQQKIFKKTNKKDFPWRDEEEEEEEDSWDDYSPKESLCSDESSRDERSPEARRNEKSPWSFSKRGPKGKCRNEVSGQWSSRGRWQDETEDEFEDTWRKRKQESAVHRESQYWQDNGCDKFKGRCERCDDWEEEWQESGRHSHRWANRRKRSESDTDYRKRCDSDASDKEFIWTLRPESQGRPGKQRQHLGQSRAFKDCSGHCHESRSKHRRLVAQKRTCSASDSKRAYEYKFSSIDYPGRGNDQNRSSERKDEAEDNLFEYRHACRDSRRRNDSECGCYRTLDGKTGHSKSGASKTGRAFGSSTDANSFHSPRKLSNAKNWSPEGGRDPCSGKVYNREESEEGNNLHFEGSEADDFDKLKAEESSRSSQEIRSIQWAAANGKSDDSVFSPTPTAVSDSFAADFGKTPKRFEGKQETTGPDKSKNKGTRPESSSLLRKSDSINIFSRDKDPFEGDEFFNSAS